MGVARKHSEVAQDRDEKAQKLNTYVESMLAYLGSMAHDMPDEQKEKLKSIIDSKPAAEGGDEKLEEPTAEESKAEEPEADEAKQEEPKPDEAKVVVDEAKAEEGKVEEVKEDEDTPEEEPAEETQP